MENLNEIGQQPNVSEEAKNVFNQVPQQENADSIAGVLDPQAGFVGGVFGNSQPQEAEQVQSVGGYVGGFISNSQAQNLNYDDIDMRDFDRTKLPVKRGFWSKVKAFLFEKEVEFEITAKEEKVLTEIHDFLFQDISFKGFMNILKIGNEKK